MEITSWAKEFLRTILTLPCNSSTDKTFISVRGRGQLQFFCVRHCHCCSLSHLVHFVKQTDSSFGERTAWRNLDEQWPDYPNVWRVSFHLQVHYTLAANQQLFTIWWTPRLSRWMRCSALGNEAWTSTTTGCGCAIIDRWVNAADWRYICSEVILFPMTASGISVFWVLDRAKRFWLSVRFTTQ